MGHVMTYKYIKPTCGRFGDSYTPVITVASLDAALGGVMIGLRLCDM